MTIPANRALQNPDTWNPAAGGAWSCWKGRWWPLAVGFSTFVVSLGLIFAVWLLIMGVVLLLLSLVGLVFEYYRGPFVDA
jgi:hypothetical protein